MLRNDANADGGGNANPCAVEWEQLLAHELKLQAPLGMLCWTSLELGLAVAHRMID